MESFWQILQHVLEAIIAEEVARPRRGIFKRAQRIARASWSASVGITGFLALRMFLNTASINDLLENTELPNSHKDHDLALAYIRIAWVNVCRAIPFTSGYLFKFYLAYSLALSVAYNSTYIVLMTFCVGIRQMQHAHIAFSMYLAILVVVLLLLGIAFSVSLGGTLLHRPGTIFFAFVLPLAAELLWRLTMHQQLNLWNTYLPLTFIVLGAALGSAFSGMLFSLFPPSIRKTIIENQRTLGIIH